MRIALGGRKHRRNYPALKHVQYQGDKASLSVDAGHRYMIVLAQKSVKSAQKFDAIDFHFWERRTFFRKVAIR